MINITARDIMSMHTAAINRNTETMNKLNDDINHIEQSARLNAILWVRTGAAQSKVAAKRNTLEARALELELANVYYETEARKLHREQLGAVCHS